MGGVETKPHILVVGETNCTPCDQLRQALKQIKRPKLPIVQVSLHEIPRDRLPLLQRAWTLVGTQNIPLMIRFGKKGVFSEDRKDVRLGIPSDDDLQKFVNGM